MKRPSAREVANALKKWRAARGFSQSQAAAELGISVRSLQSWEICHYTPSATTWALLTRLTALLDEAEK
ncbi:MAG: helix-turn-helix transcriptional regulator [Verrucomicrobia bacterium]|nr:helix-turn-helix transcriptional regulator [Verrucomicrobiota bacterium]